MWNLLRKRFSRMSMRSKLFLTIIGLFTLIDLLLVLAIPAYVWSIELGLKPFAWTRPWVH